MSDDVIKIPVYTTEELCRYLNGISTIDTKWMLSVESKNIIATVDGKAVELNTTVSVNLFAAPGSPAVMIGKELPAEAAEESSESEGPCCYAAVHCDEGKADGPLS